MSMNKAVCDENSVIFGGDSSVFPLCTSIEEESKSFLPIAKKLTSILLPLVSENSSIITELTSNIVDLQDKFLEYLYSIFQNHQINISEKITLRLDGNKQLFLLGNHSSEEKVNTILRENPYLSKLFLDITIQSTVLRDLKSLYLTVMMHKNFEYGLDTNAFSYGVSIKGEMNHFYFFVN